MVAGSGHSSWKGEREQFPALKEDRSGRAAVGEERGGAEPSEAPGEGRNHGSELTIPESRLDSEGGEESAVGPLCGASAILVHVVPAAAEGARRIAGCGQRGVIGVCAGGSFHEVSFFLLQIKIQVLSP